MIENKQRPDSTVDCRPSGGLGSVGGTARIVNANPRGCQVRRRTDPEARSRAGEFLNTLAGARPTDLIWDDTFRLQGHARVGRCELIVIAPRDQEHQTVVLTVEDWDELRCDGGNSAALISDRAIVTRQHLDAALASTICDRPPPHTA